MPMSTERWIMKKASLVIAILVSLVMVLVALPACDEVNGPDPSNLFFAAPAKTVTARTWTTMAILAGIHVAPRRIATITTRITGPPAPVVPMPMATATIPAAISI